MSESELKLDPDLTWESTGGNKAWHEMTETERLRYRLAKRTAAAQSAVASLKTIGEEHDRLRAENERLRESLQELFDAMIDYSGDADYPPPAKHLNMMRKARAVLNASGSSENAQSTT